jgi:hypothetical protein
MTAESDRSDSNMYRVIVLDGGTREDEERMRELIPNAMIVADTHGTIARRFGVSSWPSAVTISERGTIVEPEATDHE